MARDVTLGLVDVYEDSRSRFIDPITALPSDGLDRLVPACPKRTARRSGRRRYGPIA